MEKVELQRLAGLLGERGIPLLVDEVYHPLYFQADVPSAAKVPNAIVISDFSKAFSLSGLRLGWIIDRDPKRCEQLIDLRSYFTISSSPLTEAIAAHVLAHSEVVLARLREVAEANFALLRQFMERHRGTLGWVPPNGGTVAFPWLLDGRDSHPICQALAREGVLVAPGDCFGLPEHFRIGVGAQATGFQNALDVASRVLTGGAAMISYLVNQVYRGQRMNTSPLIVTLFEYKAWANDEILTTMKLLDEKLHPDDRHTAIRIVNHTYVVDRIFAGNLQRLEHGFTATNTTDTPTLEQLESAVKKSDQWYLEYVSKLEPTELNENINFTFTDGAPGRMSREEMLAHVVLHGGYHRGAIGRILAQLSITPPRDVFTGFLHVAEAATRRRVA